MRKLFTFFISLIISLSTLAGGVDDYNARQARRYTQEAEYYQKRADNYRREARYYLNKAEGYQREAAYYTRKGDSDRSKDYNRRADRTMDEYKTQIRHAADADDKAADYLKKAARLLSK